MDGHEGPDLNVTVPFPPTPEGDTVPTPPCPRPGRRRAPAAGRRARARGGGEDTHRQARPRTNTKPSITPPRGRGSARDARRRGRSGPRRPRPRGRAHAPRAQGPAGPGPPARAAPAAGRSLGDRHLRRGSRGTSAPRRRVGPASEPALAPPAREPRSRRRPRPEGRDHGDARCFPANRSEAAARAQPMEKRISPSLLLPVLRLPAIPRVSPPLWGTPPCGQDQSQVLGGGISADGRRDFRRTHYARPAAPHVSRPSFRKSQPWRWEASRR